MKKLVLTLCAAAIGLIGLPAIAQEHAAGEDMAKPSKPSTKAEKDAARAQRRASGKSIAKSDEGRLEDNPVPAAKKKATAEEKAAAKANRKAVGAAAAKSDSGRLEEGEGAPVKK